MDLRFRHQFWLDALSVTLVLLLLAALPTISGCSTAGKSPTSASLSVQDVPFRKVGESLRRAIDSRYEKLVEARQIKPIGQGENSIRDVLQEFIPVGTSFEQTRATLQAAGFVVGQRQRITPSSAEVVVAKIDPYSRVLFGFGGTTSVVVVLEPADPSNWKSVGHLEAAIVASFL